MGPRVFPKLLRVLFGINTGYVSGHLTRQLLISERKRNDLFVGPGAVDDIRDDNSTVSPGVSSLRLIVLSWIGTCCGNSRDGVGIPEGFEDEISILLTLRPLNVCSCCCLSSWTGVDIGISADLTTDVQANSGTKAQDSDANITMSINGVAV